LDPLGDAHEATVPAAERHARGQYFTPFPLIELVLDLCAAGVPQPESVMDPACGSGRFLMAARARWPDARLVGFETDPAALALAQENLPNAELHGGSFLEAKTRRRVDMLVGNPPYVRQRGRKRDLYVDFLQEAPRWLTAAGRLGLVLSSSWLDVEYGQEIRELLAREFAVEWIVESSAERWFPGAKVNTMVLEARRETEAMARPFSLVHFGEVREELPAAPTLVRRVTQQDLGAERPWGPYLRAPEWWLERWGTTATLGDLAELRRGWTTNDNGFFYPPEDAGIEERWLRPLAKSPKRVRGAHAVAADLPDRAFVVDEEPVGGARRWIDAAGRSEWRLPAQVPTRQMLVKGYGDRFRQPRFDVPVHYDQQLYGVYAADGVDEAALAGLLHSSWFGLTLELLGRVNFGDGVLWLGLRDARGLPVPDLRARGEVAGLAEGFAMLQGPAPTVVELAAGGTAWDDGLARIDAVVAELLGLGDVDVRGAWAALTQRRLRKARSRGRRR